VPPQSLIPARVKRPKRRQRSAFFQAGCRLEKQREFELTSLGLLFSRLPDLHQAQEQKPRAEAGACTFRHSSVLIWRSHILNLQRTHFCAAPWSPLSDTVLTEKETEASAADGLLNMIVFRVIFDEHEKIDFWKRALWREIPRSGINVSTSL
jgi:hypothetical protein